MTGTVKNIIDEVKLLFERDGYVLLSSTYSGCGVKLDYMCPKWHKGQISWTGFRIGHRCFVCSYERRAAKTRKRHEDVVRAFEKEGYKLLTKEYKNNRQRLKVQCPRGHITETMTWNNFAQGARRCSMCAGKAKRTLEEVEEYAQQYGYRVLSRRYVKTHAKLRFSCPRGHIYSARWNDFRSGYRCPECREWKNEKKLGSMLQMIFPNERVVHNDRFHFLGRQSIDYTIRNLKLAFEYDGRQHFEPVIFGDITKEEAAKRYVRQRECDARKSKLCKENGYCLIRIAYNEGLTMEMLKEKIEQSRAIQEGIQ